jgi:DNA polymerase III subunit epsilon
MDRHCRVPSRTKNAKEFCVIGSDCQPVVTRLDVSMNLLIIDTETTGLDPNIHQVIEVGAILYSVEHRAAIQQVSTLIECFENPAQHVNGIDPGLTQISPHGSCLWTISHMAARAEYIVAHNADFDRQWFSKAPLRPLLNHLGEYLPWLDTMDMPFPGSEPGSNLVKLALSQGVPVVSAHRALTDCQLIASIFSKQSNLEELIKIAAQPRRVVKALVSYQDRTLAYNTGFKFDRLIPRAWARKMTEAEIESFDTKLFDIEVVA